MTTRLTATVLVAATALIGCSDPTAPASAQAARPAPTPVTAEDPLTTPGGTVLAMLALAEDGDWVKYVDRFYGEKHKFRPGRNDLENVASRLESRAEGIIGSLQRVSAVEPVMEDDGARAVYDIGEDQRFMLYRTEEGRWAFHL